MTARTITAAAAALICVATASADTLKFNNTASRIEFVGTKKDGSHTGQFKKFSGTIDMPGSDFAQAKVDVEIDVDSLKADNEKLTAHLKSPDFFDVRSHPTARFVSSRIRGISGDGVETHLILGDLTMHGVTRSVRVPVQATVTPTGVKLTGTFVIHRKEFGMTFGDKMINDDVKVTLTVQASR